MRAVLISVALAASACFADDMLLGAGETNRVVQSKVVRENAWKRDVVSTDGLGQIHNDRGLIAETAETAAVNDVADRASEIADAAREVMENSLEYVRGKTHLMSTNGFGIAIAFAPETDDVNIRGFVVKTETVDGTDTQWVHYNREMALPPNRVVVFERNDGTVAKQKVTWEKPWDAAGTNLTVGGRSWSGLHRCTVERPSWAVGRACLDLPNETWGGEDGMNWGDMVLTHGDVPYYTGFVTNNEAGVVAHFDNGFLKELSPIGE